MSALPLSLFDFTLPDELVAQEPARPRDASRLLFLPRSAGPTSHHVFTDLPSMLQPGDLLVVNRTQVIPARLRGLTPFGGKVEVLLMEPVGASIGEARQWRVMGKPGSALQPGKQVRLTSGAVLVVESRDGMHAVVRADEPILALALREGEMPLPPYIARQQTRSTDTTDYQSIFAAEPGAIAAPTASLHFTERVLQALRERDIRRAEVTLHVGPGTFLPVRKEHADDIRQHEMHAEWYEVPEATRALIAETKQKGGRVIAVGTTSLRALETWHQSKDVQGASRIFIYPGYTFGVVDGLVTNFHLPRSTLLMLVSALAGRDRVLAAYEEAVRERYRFYSYGDAMLIV